jgi:hypothetical protein
LLAAQNRDRGRNRRRDSRGHGQTRPDYQWKEKKNDEQIGEALQHIVRPGFFLTRPREEPMPGNRCGKPPWGKVRRRGKQIPPEMPFEKSEA